MMVVILLGHIDLSVPWTLTAGAMMATAVGGPAAIPVGLGVGFLVGLVNGLGVAYLRVPVHDLHPRRQRGDARADGGPHGRASRRRPRRRGAMQYLAVGRIGSIPVALLVWLAVSASS